jgi:hypothetical protein
LPIGRGPRSFSILSSIGCSSNGGLESASRPLQLAVVEHDDPDFAGGPSAIQSASHSPTASASRSGSAKVLTMGVDAVEDRDRVPRRLSAVGSGVANASEIFERNSRTGARPPEPSQRGLRDFAEWRLCAFGQSHPANATTPRG